MKNMSPISSKVIVMLEQLQTKEFLLNSIIEYYEKAGG
jgi:hypothetical protein